MPMSANDHDIAFLGKYRDAKSRGKHDHDKLKMTLRTIKLFLLMIKASQIYEDGKAIKA